MVVITKSKYICPRCGKILPNLKSCKEHFELYQHTGNYNNFNIEMMENKNDKNQF